VIAIIDYGAGNLHSVQKGFEKVGAKATVTSDPGQVAAARAVVLPGVGSYGLAMQSLERLGLTRVLTDVIRGGKHFLGICLGLQVLLEGSEEALGSTGLGIIPGRVRRFPGGLKVPHMGWNQLYFARQDPLFEGVEPGAWFYFVHSYYADPRDEEWVLGRADYGVPFTAALGKGNVRAVQFHPEKSGRLGLKVLANFVGLMN